MRKKSDDRLFSVQIAQKGADDFVSVILL